MPEGDTIHQAAARLQALVGETVERVEGSHRAVVRDGKRLAGKKVTDVESVGKHLFVHFDNGWSVRTHLGMPGVWRLYRPGQRWSKSPGMARVVIRTPEHVAVCYSAPSVDVLPRRMAEERIAHLGPDLIAADEPDWDDVVARARRRTPATAADLALDQQVMAGIGNVIKSEVLFLEGIHPEADPAGLTDEQVAAIARRGRRLLLANRRPGPRNTTGDRGRGRGMWVYGRSRQACRRCRAPIEEAEIGAFPRITYWCPRCQPAA